jgi:hypothetical protein
LSLADGREVLGRRAARTDPIADLAIEMTRAAPRGTSGASAVILPMTYFYRRDLHH